MDVWTRTLAWLVSGAAALAGAAVLMVPHSCLDCAPPVRRVLLPAGDDGGAAPLAGDALPIAASYRTPVYGEAPASQRPGEPLAAHTVPPNAWYTNAWLAAERCNLTLTATTPGAANGLADEVVWVTALPLGSHLLPPDEMFTRMNDFLSLGA